MFTRTISLKEEIVNQAEFKIKWLFSKRDCVFRPKLMTACSEYFVKFNTPLSRNKKSYRFVAFMSSLTEKACDIDFIFVRISFILMSYDDTSCKFLLEKNFCFFFKKMKNRTITIVRELAKINIMFWPWNTLQNRSGKKKDFVDLYSFVVVVSMMR